MIDLRFSDGLLLFCSVHNTHFIRKAIRKESKEAWRRAFTHVTNVSQFMSNLSDLVHLKEFYDALSGYGAKFKYLRNRLRRLCCILPFMKSLRISYLKYFSKGLFT